MPLHLAVVDAKNLQLVIKRGIKRFNELLISNPGYHVSSELQGRVIVAMILDWHV